MRHLILTLIACAITGVVMYALGSHAAAQDRQRANELSIDVGICRAALMELALNEGDDHGRCPARHTCPDR